jgi:hypothetical protein
MDRMERTSKAAGWPCCISFKELPKSIRIALGHDLRTSKESPSHEIEARRVRPVEATI